jgi:vitamin B12 transporter
MLSMMLRQYEATSQYDGYNSDALKAANDVTAYSENRNQVASLSYSHDNTKVHYNQSHFNRLFAPSSHFDGRTIEAGLEHRLNYKQKDSLNIGLTKRSDEVLNSVNKRYNINSIFITNQNSNDEGIILNETLRYDQNSEFENITTYRIGFKQSFQEELSYALNIASGYNAPTLNQMFGAVGANKDLLAESTQSIDLNLNLFGLHMTYYYNEVDNLIDYVITDYTTYAGSYNNLNGTSTLKGYEIEYANTFERLDTTLSINYTLLNAVDNQGKTLARRPEDSVNIALEYFPIDTLFIALNANYVGERFNQNDKQGVQTGKYTLFSGNISYDVISDVTIYAKAENLGNKAYEVVDGYSVAQRSFFVGFQASH